MKRKGNIYKEIVDVNKIIDIYESKVKKNTKNKYKLEKFENNYSSNIINIYKTLEDKKYNGGKYNIFLIHEPKVRVIMSQSITDKIINHLVSYYFIKPYFESKLIDTNIATRINKGTHYGLKLTKKYIISMNKTFKTFYYLKFDIKKYFFNIDHEVLKSIILKYIKDKDVINIINNIIDSTDKKYINKKINNLKVKEIDIPLYKKGKGLPIGNLTSQMLGIIYLNELDHFIKENLHIKYYIRYMDDGLLIYEDKEYLKHCLKEIIKILGKYKLLLNQKTYIRSINEGIDFFGFTYFIKNNKVIMKVKSSSKKRMKNKIKKMQLLVSKNKISMDKFDQTIMSYKGHLMHGNTNSLINKYLS